MAKASGTQKKAQKKIDEFILKRIEAAIEEPVENGLSAAFITAVSKRYENIQPVTLPGSTRDRIISNLRLAGGGKLPAVSDDTDAATA